MVTDDDDDYDCDGGDGGRGPRGPRARAALQARPVRILSRGLPRGPIGGRAFMHM